MMNHAELVEKHAEKLGLGKGTTTSRKAPVLWEKLPCH